MAKYKVNYTALGGVDCSALIEAVARYLSVEEYPLTYVIAAILGIEKVEEE